MQNSKSILLILARSILYTGLFLAPAIGVLPVVADGTREIFSDLGLFAGDSEGTIPCRMDIYVWPWPGTNTTLDAKFDGGPTCPEGRYVLSANVARNWGGYGFFHVSQFDTSLVKEYDYSVYAGGDILFWLKSSTSLNVEVEFVSDAGATQKSGSVIQGTGNAWKEIGLPISSFSPAINLKRIRGPFLITATQGAGSKTWYVDHVRYTKPLASLDIFPKTAYVPAGSRVQFTVEGRTSSGEPVLVYPTFTTTGAITLLDPLAPKLSLAGVFRAADTPSSGTVVATAVGPTRLSPQVTATVSVGADSVLTKAGLLSESAPAFIQLDVDSKLLAFSGGAAAEVLLTTRTNEFSEGTESLAAAVNHTAETGFSGWTIAVGKEGSPDSETKDMSAFYDGTLRFMINAPQVLATNMFVGIRSGNVPAGKELSRVSLADYTSFDNQWHTVTIPIAVFAKARPWADLSRIKNLFTILVIGDTSGPQEFLVDDIYWEARLAPLKLRALGIGSDGKTFRLQLNGPSGLAYSIESSADLRTWAEVQSGTMGSSTVEYVHTIVPEPPFLFFRAKNP